MSGQEAAAALLAALHNCQLDLGEHGMRIWLAYDFGGECTHRTYLETSRTDDEYCAEIWDSVEVGPASGGSNAFYLRLLLWFSQKGARVESLVEAHLDEAIGEYGPGSYVLYKHRTDNLDLDGALRAAREHLEALYGIEDYPRTLGMSRR